MKKLSLIAVFVFIFLSANFAFGQNPTPTATPPDDDNTVKITTSLIQLDVVVTDKAGNPVTDLKPEDFRVYQDGKLQTITNLTYVNSQTAEKTLIPASGKKKHDKNEIPVPPSNSNSKQGRIVTFILDDGNCKSTFEGINAMRDAMSKFVDQQMLPSDRVAIYQTKAGVSLLQLYTSNKSVLKRRIDKIGGVLSLPCRSSFDAATNDSTGIGDGRFESDRDKDRREDSESKQYDQKVMGTVGVANFVIDRLKSIPQRKILFLLSEGLTLTSTSTRDALRQLTEKASRASVVINTVSNRGLSGPSILEARDNVSPNDTTSLADARTKEALALDDGLAFLAMSTGGTFVHGQNDIVNGIKKVLDRQTSYYLVSYEPDDETFKGKKFHDIDIKLNRPDLRVSSRNGFFGNAESEPRPVYKTADSPMYEAMESPLQDTGMDIALTVLHGNTEAGGNFIRPLFHLKLEDVTLQDDVNGAKKAVLDVVGVTLDGKNKVADEFNRTYTLQIPKEALQLAMQNGLDFSADMIVKKPGVYSFRIAVRDNASKRLAAASDYVEIEDVAKKNFFMSGLIAMGADANGLPMIPESRNVKEAFLLVKSLSVPSIRQFSKGSKFYYSFIVYNAKNLPGGSPKLTQQVKLYHNGKLIFDGDETPVLPGTDGSRIQHIGNINISNAVEVGGYVLQIVVRDKIANRTSSQWIDFEVIP